MSRGPSHSQEEAAAPLSRRGPGDVAVIGVLHRLTSCNLTFSSWHVHTSTQNGGASEERFRKATWNKRADLCFQPWFGFKQDGFEKETKKNPGELAVSTGNCIMAYVGNTPRYQKGDYGKKNWKSDKSWGPLHKRTPSPVTLCSRFPNIMRGCILLVLLPQLSCQVQIFPLPFLSFFRSLEAQGTCLPKSQDSATTQLTRDPGGSFGDHSSSMKWTRPPVLQHHSMSNGLYMLCHFIFKQLEWGVSSLYTGINWGSDGPTVRWGAGMWAQVSLIQSPQQRKTKTPWKHHYFQCVSTTRFRANAYGALGYLHDYSVLTLWGKALLSFYRAGN